MLFFGFARTTSRIPIAQFELVLSFTPSFFAPLAASLAPVCPDRHFAIVHDVQSGLAEGLKMLRSTGLSAMLRIAERLSLNGADRVFCLHDAMRARLRDLGVSKGIDITPIWVDQRASSAMTDRPEQDRPVLMYMGNLGRKQGLEQLVDLAEDLQEAGHPAQLVVRGSGTQERALKAEVHGRELSNVRFEPLVPESRLFSAIAEADLHLVPQLPGGSDFAIPSKVFNILAARRTLVATCEPGTPLWTLNQDARAFRCVQPGDRSAMLEAVAELLDDPEHRRELADRGFEYVHLYHSIDTVLGNVLRHAGWTS